MNMALNSIYALIQAKLPASLHDAIYFPLRSTVQPEGHGWQGLGSVRGFHSDPCETSTR